MSPLTNEIRSKGYWWIVVHPVSYEKERVPYEMLERILRRALVRLRGWDFPHIDVKQPVRKHLDSISQETDWRYYREQWRFYQSGQFAYLIAIHEDWANHSEGWGPPKELAEGGPLLGMGDTLYRLTEAFRFASRLAVTEAGDDAMHIKIELHGLKNRRLWWDSVSRPWFDSGAFQADIDVFPYEDNFATSDLASDADLMAAEAARMLFLRFNWDAPVSLLQELQRTFRQ